MAERLVGMMSNSRNALRDSVIPCMFSCWVGWLTLGLVESGLRFMIEPPPPAFMIFLILSVYSLIGIIFGLICSAIAFLGQPLWRDRKRPFQTVHFSMAASIAAILFVYALLFFIKVGLYENTPMAFFKSIVLFVLSLALLFLLPFFFSWIHQRGKLFISYFSILPAFWIIVSLKLNRNKDLLPHALQVTSFPHVLLLIMCSAVGLFLLYLLFSLVSRFLGRVKAVPLMKSSLIILPCVFLVVLLFLFLRKGDEKVNKRIQKNPPSGKPNIVLITLDTARADHLSCYGYKRLTTPNVDKFSREGMLYANAYATASWTLPSHASIFTGMYPTKHGAEYNPGNLYDEKLISENQEEKKFTAEMTHARQSLKLSEDSRTMAEILSGNGYRTAGIIGGIFCSSTFGLAQGFDYYNEIFFNVEKDIQLFLVCQAVDLFFPLNDFFSQYGYMGKRIASQVNKAAFTWLDNNYSQPFFLFINYFDPHNPYLSPPPFDRYFGETDKGILLGSNFPQDLSFVSAEENLIMATLDGRHQITAEEKEALTSAYDSELRYLDHSLGVLLERLKALKVYDDTLIIITSDHGEAFGEHNLLEHGLSLHEEVLRVPLIVKYPAASLRRGVEEKRVSLVDLLPTVLSFLGLPLPSGIDGKNFDSAERTVIAETYACWWANDKFNQDLKAIYQGKYKYIWSSRGLNELYDLEKDPGEKENLLQTLSAQADAMEKGLKQWLASFTPPKTAGKARVSKLTEEQLRALGYIR